MSKTYIFSYYFAVVFCLFWPSPSLSTFSCADTFSPQKPWDLALRFQDSVLQLSLPTHLTAKALPPAVINGEPGLIIQLVDQQTTNSNQDLETITRLNIPTEALEALNLVDVNTGLVRIHIFNHSRLPLFKAKEDLNHVHSIREMQSRHDHGVKVGDEYVRKIFMASPSGYTPFHYPSWLKLSLYHLYPAYMGPENPLLSAVVESHGNKFLGLDIQIELDITDRDLSSTVESIADAFFPKVFNEHTTQAQRVLVTHRLWSRIRMAQKGLYPSSIIQIPILELLPPYVRLRNTGFSPISGPNCLDCVVSYYNDSVQPKIATHSGQHLDQDIRRGHQGFKPISPPKHQAASGDGFIKTDRTQFDIHGLNRILFDIAFTKDGQFTIDGYRIIYSGSSLAKYLKGPQFPEDNFVQSSILRSERAAAPETISSVLSAHTHISKPELPIEITRHTLEAAIQLGRVDIIIEALEAGLEMPMDYHIPMSTHPLTLLDYLIYEGVRPDQMKSLLQTHGSEISKAPEDSYPTILALAHSNHTMELLAVILGSPWTRDRVLSQLPQLAHLIAVQQNYALFHNLIALAGSYITEPQLIELVDGTINSTASQTENGRYFSRLILDKISHDSPISLSPDSLIELTYSALRSKNLWSFQQLFSQLASESIDPMEIESVFNYILSPQFRSNFSSGQTMTASNHLKYVQVIAPYMKETGSFSAMETMIQFAFRTKDHGTITYFLLGFGVFPKEAIVHGLNFIEDILQNSPRLSTSDTLFYADLKKRLERRDLLHLSEVQN
jgi:hypothetical protein